MSNINEPMGQWCLRALQCSSRELRIAAARSLTPYFATDIPEEITDQNQRVIINFLKTLKDRNNLVEQETLTFAYRVVGSVCQEDLRVLCVSQLVDYLGHPQTLVASAAYDALLGLSDDLGSSVYEILRTESPIIAIPTVEDVVKRPQKAQNLVDLIGTSVDNYLCTTQIETLPYLVLKRRNDILQRIVQAREVELKERVEKLRISISSRETTSRDPNDSLERAIQLQRAGVTRQDLFLKPTRHLAAVLAYLLIHQTSDVENSIMTSLKEAAPGLEQQDLTTLVNLEPITIACDILKTGSHGGDDARVRAHHGINNLAFFVERRNGQSRASKNAKHLDSFFDNHILGIMAHFTDILDFAKDRYELAERQQALDAIQQLIVLAHSASQLSAIVPQVKAILQTAMTSAELIDPAFATWSTMASLASEEDIEIIVDQTFATIQENWTAFAPKTQALAHETILNLLKNHNVLIRDRIEMIPDLANIELLQKPCAEIQRLKDVIDPLARLTGFALRCSEENIYVVRAAAKELIDFLEEHQYLIYESIVSQQPAPGIGRLYQTLLDAVVRFKEIDNDILDLCSICLGSLGAVDPNLLEITRDEGSTLMLSNFERSTDVIDFVSELLEHVLVKAFHSASTPKAQAYLAYVIQELLKFCGFRQAVATRPRASQGDLATQKWREFPEQVRLTLMPFFNSKYHVFNPAKPSEDTQYPIFNPSLSRSTWLRTLVFVLLHRATGENAPSIFAILSKVIWGHDIAIASFILPFVVQNVIIGGEDKEMQDLQTEFLQVLSQDTSALSQTELANVKQCSEVCLIISPKREVLTI